MLQVIGAPLAWVTSPQVDVLQVQNQAEAVQVLVLQVGHQFGMEHPRNQMFHLDSVTRKTKRIPKANG